MATLEAVDSWLSVNGRIRAFDAHVARFRRAVEFAHGDGDAAVNAMLEARAATPREGTFFPRVQYSDGAFDLQVRPNPQLKESMALWTAPNDPREVPGVKGPDIASLTELHRDASQHGADEAVLLSVEGHIIESGFSALCWWRGDELCYPDEDLDRVDSVTWKCVRSLAAAEGIRLQPEFSTPLDLAGTELWALNARHGIRFVHTWHGGPELGQPVKFASWRSRLETLAEEVIE